MSLKQISPNAHQFTKFGLMNAYFVRESDGFTLIDTTLGAAVELLKSAESLGAPIRRILLTHAHSDHIGSLDELAKHLGGSAASTKQLASFQVAISARESRLLPKKPKQDRSLEPGEPQCKLKGGFPGATTPATHVLLDNELYGSLRCIATPGHTPGHFSFLDERDGTLYAGDALITIGGTPHIPGFGPWYFPLPKFATWHRPTAVASIERLTTLPLATPIQRIAAGHGRLVTGGIDLLATSIAQAKQRAPKMDFSTTVQARSNGSEKWVVSPQTSKPEKASGNKKESGSDKKPSTQDQKQTTENKEADAKK